MLSVIGVDFLGVVLTSVVVVFIFARLGRSRSSLEVTADLGVLDTEVGFDFGPAICSVVKIYR